MFEFIASFLSPILAFWLSILILTLMYISIFLKKKASNLFGVRKILPLSLKKQNSKKLENMDDIVLIDSFTHAIIGALLFVSFYGLIVILFKLEDFYFSTRVETQVLIHYGFFVFNSLFLILSLIFYLFFTKKEVGKLSN